MEGQKSHPTEYDAAILQVYAIGEDYLKGRGVIPSGKVFSPSTEPYKLLVKNAFTKEPYIIGNQQNPIIKVLDINDYLLDNPAILL